ncbi:MAG: KR domain-containing protein, partial [Acidobacteria bacterium]|nr:KR domain-containing protein [Acidobacteriota bacterium]
MTNDRFYKTGDLACWLPDGNIKFLGRIDNQIKIRGFRVELGEIEAQLARFVGIKQVVVMLQKDNNDENCLAAYIVSTNEIDTTQLRRYLLQKLPDYMAPAYFIRVDKIPLTSNGKVDQKALSKPGGHRLKLKETYVAPQDNIEKIIANAWKEVLKIDSVGVNDNFFDLGGNSLNIIRLSSKLGNAFKKEIPVSTLFNFPTIDAQAKYLRGEAPWRKDKNTEIFTPDKAQHLEIAVIGMAGRFPGAPDINTFWENLKNGICSISFFSDEELAEAGVFPAVYNQQGYVKAKGILNDVEFFDASFFNYTSREAELMNPQFRILHECTWEALENAGYSSEMYGGKIGFFAGLTDNLYWLSRKLTQETTLSEQFEIFNLNSNSFSTLLSYKMNLTGPSLTVQTACSTSLAAIHQACRSLLDGECRLALAGGASILFPVKSGYLYQPGMIKSPDGFCRAFDAQANGTIGGDGVAIVVLKLLEHALADGDHIEAVIKGTAINNDGSRKVGYTAPSVEGQAEVINAALEMAQIGPETISYVETHGTGTIMGDPIEIEALKLAFHSSKKGFCRIGSVKTNIGHLDAAAGAAGFIKTVLILKHKLVAPSLHFISPNPSIDFENSPFRVNTQLVEWKSGHFPRRAGVSSFGIGGTNIHIILEEAPSDLIQTTTERAYKLIMLSAKSQSALDSMTENLATYIMKNPGLNLDHVAYTLQTGRNIYPYRRFLICSNHAETLDALSAPTPTAGKIFTHMDKADTHPVVFIFPGLGGQYINMGLDLYRTEPRFQQEMDRCFQILESSLGIDIKKILYPVDPSLSMNEFQDFESSQIALFIFEYSLATLLISWGIKPYAMVGYSFGEYTAACIAGVFSLEDALKLVAARGRLIRNAAPGAMISVPLEASQLTPWLTTFMGIFIAIDNGPSCVLAGLEAEVTAFEKEMKKKRLICTRLPAAHALHTPLLGPAAKELHTIIASEIVLNKPRIPYISNITGDWITVSQAMDAEYWVQHLSQTVRFADGVKKLMAEPGTIFLEIGPGKDISTLLLRYTQDNPQRHIIPMVRNARENVADDTYLVKKTGLLWLYGVPIDWRGYYAFQKPKRTTLPTYPFERRQFPLGKQWLQPGMAASASTKLLKKPGISNWFYAPAWKPSVLPIAHPKTAPMPGGCLLFMDEGGFGRPLMEKLEALAGEVICINSGKEFSHENTRSYVMNPVNRKHYEQLIDVLKREGRVPRLIVHLWGITAGGHGGECDLENVNREQETGFYSLLKLAQAIGYGNFSREEIFRLIIITDNMQYVPGQETLYPGKATILGALKVIPKEYPFIRCRSIDIVLPQRSIWQHEKLYNQLWAEIATAGSIKDDVEIIALRGWNRLLQHYEAIPLQESGQPARRLRQKGTYLVTGGLGGIGLEIAKFLAQDFQARLVLTGRTLFPPQREWDRLLSGAAGMEQFSTPGIAAEIESLVHTENQFTQEYGIRGIKNRDGLEKTTNQLCCALIYDYFKRCHIDIGKEQIYDKSDLMAQLKILSRFHRFYEFFIHVLHEDGWIKVEGNQIRFIQESIEQKSLQQLMTEAECRYPSFKGTFRLLEHCAGQYKDALSGEIEPMSVLYPGEKPIHLMVPYQNLEETSTRVMYCRMLQELIFKLLKKWRTCTRREIKILEVGAGTGTLTRLIAPYLKDFSACYYFTDIGKYFLLNARQEETYTGLSYMVFQRLDISQDPLAQGYEAHDFDIILGLNVVHATPDISVTLGHLKKLLAPGGKLALVETIQYQRWLDMVDGLAEGWWYFQDEELRKDSPLMDLERWQLSFQNQGFKNITVFPRVEDTAKRTNSDTGMIVAEQDSAITMAHCHESKTRAIAEEHQTTLAKIQQLQQLKALGSEVLVRQTDVTNLEQMQVVVEETGKVFGPIHGVIHCAGELDFGGVIHGRTQAVNERILAPKVRGTLVLDRVFNETPLDFFVLCSSLSSVVAPFGQVGHCAANAFLDAFTHYRTLNRGKFTVAINWDAWKDVGTAQAAEKHWNRAYDFIDYSIDDFALSPA